MAHKITFGFGSFFVISICVECKKGNVMCMPVHTGEKMKWKMMTNEDRKDVKCARKQKPFSWKCVLQCRKNPGNSRNNIAAASVLLLLLLLIRKICEREHMAGKKRKTITTIICGERRERERESDIVFTFGISCKLSYNNFHVLNFEWSKSEARHVKGCWTNHCCVHVTLVYIMVNQSWNRIK